MPTLDEVKEQIKALKHKYIFYTKKEIAYLPEIMADDERILALTSGFHGNTTVLLVCTNRRVLFVDKGMFFGLKVKQLNLDRIQSIDSSYIILFGSIRIWDGAAAYEISMILKDSIDPFVKTVREAVENYRRIVFHDVTRQQQQQQAPAQHPPPRPSYQAPASTQQDNDPLTQLERLAKLHEAGHLTDAEFEAQKRKVLDGSH